MHHRLSTFNIFEKKGCHGITRKIWNHASAQSRYITMALEVHMQMRSIVSRAVPAPCTGKLGRLVEKVVSVFLLVVRFDVTEKN